MNRCVDSEPDTAFHGRMPLRGPRLALPDRSTMLREVAMADVAVAIDRSPTSAGTSGAGGRPR
jgi:hypothetical protein